MIDNYTYFNDLQLNDFIYILSSLKNKGLINFNTDEKLVTGLSEILEDYIGE